MVFITEELVRKRAEHNNYEISSLEELSLHQQDLEKIEHLDKWCKELKILYLQSNLIPRIENVGKLKKLEYLNLALNNVSKVENLAGCESLKKLDLTVNFIDDLTSIESLRENKLFRELYLTGNPCTQYEDYRKYVIATLPHLYQLDGKEIEKSERIQATQEHAALRDSILQQQRRSIMKREKEKSKEDDVRKDPGYDGRWYTDIGEESKDTLKESKVMVENEQELSEDEKEKRYWSQPSKFTPESRVEMHKHIQEQQEKKSQKKGGFFDEESRKREVKFFKENGEPLNVNTSKIDFTLKEDEENGLITLDVACYKHLDTSLMDVDVQPRYVRVAIKEKFLQLALMDEVSPDRATAKRSQTSGHLVISMPKVRQVIRKAPTAKSISAGRSTSGSEKADGGKKDAKNNFLSLSDLSTIIDRSEREQNEHIEDTGPFSDDFIDDPDVPPLI